MKSLFTRNTSRSSTAQVVFAVLLIAFTASACDTVQKSFSNVKRTPDEFVVYARPPLSLPPEFSLQAPRPGTQDTQRVNPRDEAQAALISSTGRQVQTQQVSNATPGLLALMEKTGANRADPNIRQELESELVALADDEKRLIDRIMFWQEEQPYQGTIVDAAKEQRRILENKALGKPLNEGEVPEIKLERKRSGLLNF